MTISKDVKSLPKTIQDADKPMVSNDGHQRFKESVTRDPAEAIRDSQTKRSGGPAHGQESSPVGITVAVVEQGYALG